MTSLHLLQATIPTKNRRRPQEIYGSPQEFVRIGILRGLPVFLKSDAFGVGHHHALCFQ
jgi:hypothetical protein